MFLFDTMVLLVLITVIGAVSNIKTIPILMYQRHDYLLC